MAVATSMALGVAPCVAPSIAHRSTLSVLSVLNGLRLSGKAARQLPLSNSQGVGQRLGGLAPGSAVCGVRGSSSLPITSGQELPSSSRLVTWGKLGLAGSPLRRLQRKKRRTVGREESGQTALSVVY